MALLPVAGSAGFIGSNFVHHIVIQTGCSAAAFPNPVIRTGIGR